MFSPETTDMLRCVLEEVCEHVGQYENDTRTHVASKLLEAASSGEQTIASLKKVGRTALKDAPTVWRR
jgi:hypothetical protein